MGEIKVQVRFDNDHDTVTKHEGKLGRRKVRSVLTEAVVDTGAVMMLLPQELVEELGLRVFDTSIVQLADDRKIEMERAGGVGVTIADRRMVIDCLVGPPGSEPLIGQLVMEGLDLIQDPVRRTLTPRPESPFRPTLKMKRGGPPDSARELTPAFE